MINQLKGNFRFWVWVLQDLLFPRHCHVCSQILPHENRTYLCHGCTQNIRYISLNACPGCAKPVSMEGGEQSQTIDQRVCSNCLKNQRSYETCAAVCFYEGPVKQLLQSLKFERGDYLIGTIQKIFLDGINGKMDWRKFDVLMPVPLHPRKLRERGFNQSLIVAEAIQWISQLPIDRKTLVRKKYSGGQTLQDKRERLENIRGSFSVCKPEKIKQKSVLLIDDVLTTGATIQECARVLIEAGAKKVNVLILARSV